MAEGKSGGKIAIVIVAIVIGGCLVCGVGGGAVGYTSYRDYLLQSKTSEATHELGNLYRLSASYYAQESWATRTVSRTTAGANTSCTVDPAITTNTPSGSKTAIDWTREAPSFQAIGFAAYDPIYYRYEIAGPPGRCQHGPNESLYSFRARGDLDEDGTQSLFELAAGSDPQNVMYRTPSVFIENETE
jgi:hypothetical protein